MNASRRQYSLFTRLLLAGLLMLLPVALVWLASSVFFFERLQQASRLLQLTDRVTIATLEVRHAEHVRRVEVPGGEGERLGIACDRLLETARLLVREGTGEDAVQRAGYRGRPRADRAVALLVAPPAAAGTRRVAGRGRRDVDGQFVQ